MTVVVSDTSPLRALDFLGRLDVLRSLFDRILVPPAVSVELARGGRRFRPFDVQNTEWLELRAPADPERVRHLLDQLDIGEAESIVLASETAADALLIDETDGRNVARSQFGLEVIGTLGILVAAKQRGLIQAVELLIVELRDELGFYISDALHEEVLKLAGESR